ncbi:MAG: hypothetical protein ACI9MC_002764 [Kiritimatiellia bacterium]|jgi:hypothetical protein
MARIKKQQRREARGDWVKSGDGSRRWKKTPRGPHDPIQRALRAVESTDNAWAKKRGRRLVFWISERAPHLLPDVELLRRLAYTPWPACPRERFPNVDLRHRSDLIRVLLERYPLPCILRRAFEDGSGQPERFCLLASLIAGGGGLRQAKQLGLVPDTTTKRVFAAFIGGRVESSMAVAWRIAQARSVGLPTAVGALVSRQERRQSRASIWHRDGYWLRTFRWIARQDLVTLDLDLIVGFLNDHQIDLAGRTAASVTRMAQSWWAEHTSNGHGPSVFAPGYESSGLLGLGTTHEGWRIDEIITPLALWTEGQRMHHCVYSYRPALRSGRASIWSLSQHGIPMLTVHVLRKRREVSEVRGQRNRRPTDIERRVLEAWAASNALTARFR